MAKGTTQAGGREARRYWVQATHPTARALRWLGMVPFVPSSILLFSLLLLYWPGIERNQDLKAWMAGTLAVFLVAGLLLAAGSVVERLLRGSWPRLGTHLLNIVGLCAVAAGSVLLAIGIGAALFATIGEGGASLARRALAGALGFLAAGASALAIRAGLNRMEPDDLPNADIAVGLGLLAVMVPLGNPWLLGVG